MNDGKKTDPMEEKRVPSWVFLLLLLFLVVVLLGVESALNWLLPPVGR